MHLPERHILTQLHDNTTLQGFAILQNYEDKEEE